MTGSVIAIIMMMVMMIANIAQLVKFTAFLQCNESCVPYLKNDVFIVVMHLASYLFKIASLQKFVAQNVCAII